MIETLAHGYLSDSTQYLRNTNMTGFRWSLHPCAMNKSSMRYTLGLTHGGPALMAEWSEDVVTDCLGSNHRHILSQQDVLVSFGHQNPQTPPLRTPKYLCESFLKMSISTIRDTWESCHENTCSLSRKTVFSRNIVGKLTVIKVPNSTLCT